MIGSQGLIEAKYRIQENPLSLSKTAIGDSNERLSIPEPVELLHEGTENARVENSSSDIDENGPLK